LGVNEIILKFKGELSIPSVAQFHTLHSDALSHGAKIKWLAEYCGTSVAMIESITGAILRAIRESS
jgi:hypothetical protein